MFCFPILEPPLLRVFPCFGRPKMFFTYRYCNYKSRIENSNIFKSCFVSQHIFMLLLFGRKHSRIFRRFRPSSQPQFLLALPRRRHRLPTCQPNACRTQPTKKKWARNPDRCQAWYVKLILCMILMFDIWLCAGCQSFVGSSKSKQTCVGDGLVLLKIERSWI